MASPGGVDARDADANANANDATAADRPPHIQVRELGRRYPGKRPVVALESASLDVAHGEFVSVLGPSGCGKSTLLRCIAGLDDATSGVLAIDGHVRRPGDGPPAGLGMVFQRDVLLDWRDVLGNVLLPLALRGELQGARAAHETRARHLLSLFGLEAFATRYPWELSGGMRQRVSICRALIDDPSLLLMDEPFGAIDALTREQLNVELQRIWLDSRKTVLFITHDIAEAVFLADRVAVFSPRPGRIVDTLAIDLPRPRSLAMRDDPAHPQHARFSQYRARIRGLFEDMGLLHDA
nr:ABC transporter ATP-binding protein [Robbsia betulipollinis]